MTYTLDRKTATTEPGMVPEVSEERKYTTLLIGCAIMTLFFGGLFGPLSFLAMAAFTAGVAWRSPQGKALRQRFTRKG